MNSEFLRLKTELIKLQDIHESNEDENQMNDLMSSLNDLEEELKDFQADFSSNKSELGFLRFHFHKLKSLTYKSLKNEQKWLREQRIYLQYSMYAEIYTSENSDSQQEITDENDGHVNDDFEMLEEKEMQPQTYKSFLADNSKVLKNENLNVVKNKKFFAHYFELCDESNMETNSDSKKVNYYMNVSNLKARLENFIKEDLISLDETKEKLTAIEVDLNEKNENYTILTVQDCDKDAQCLNELELDVVQSFCFFQKKFTLKSLNLTSDEFKLIFYDNTDNSRTCKEKYNKYVLLFHPDKNSIVNRSILTEFFVKLTKLKDSIVCKHLQRGNKFDMSVYKQEGMNFFDIGMDYYRCSLGKFYGLKCLDVKDVNQNDFQSNEKLAKFYFEQAYERLRDACLIADDKKNYGEMLDLRILISQCFSKIQNRKLEAQLAALGCIHLVNKRFPDKYTDKQREEAQKNSDKVQKGCEEEGKETRNTKAVAEKNDLNTDKLHLNNGIKLFREFLNVDKNLITIYTDKNLQQHELLKNNIKTCASHFTSVVAFASAVGKLIQLEVLKLLLNYYL
jgi:hypothetical protein